MYKFRCVSHVSTALHVLLLCTFAGQVWPQGGPVVDTIYGPVRGSTITVNPYDVDVNAFHGIYFARAPVGDLRFAAPQPPEPWTEVRDATELGPSCIQQPGQVFLLTHPQWDYFSEDCLHLDVFTPTDASDGPYPVMVWIHGGAYRSGANIQYPGHYLAAKGVVVVVLQYRLGNLGFMYTGDSAAPGNAGMLDQVFALQWVQDNIANFGGDPDLVTIFGQSAGGASVGLHLMSPLSAGLFSGAILESGTEVSFWATNIPGSHPEDYAFNVARQLDCPTDDTQEMIDCLRLVEPTALERTYINCTDGHLCLGMVPVVDGPGGFLPDTPFNILNSGEYNQVPELVSHTSEDGMYFLRILVLSPLNMTAGLTREQLLNLIDIGVDFFMPAVEDETLRTDLEQALAFMYSPWPYIHDMELNRDQLGHLVTDAMFGVPADAQAKAHSFTNDVYEMVYGYRSNNSQVFDWAGVIHSAEIPYVFGLAYLPLNPDIRNDSGIDNDAVYNDFDREVAEFMMTLWTNFAKTRNPTPTPVQPPGNWPPVTWEPLTMDAANYLWLDDEVAEVRKDYRQTEYAFWREYLRCMITGDFPHIPGFTACESAVPEPDDVMKQSESAGKPQGMRRFSDRENIMSFEELIENWEDFQDYDFDVY